MGVHVRVCVCVSVCVGGGGGRLPPQTNIASTTPETVFYIFKLCYCLPPRYAKLRMVLLIHTSCMNIISST